MNAVPEENQTEEGQRRDRYLAMLSHDLKSALSGVIGGLQQIDTAALDAASIANLTGAITSATDAARLIDGVLDMEAIEKQNFELNPEPTEVSEILNEIYRRWSVRANAKGLNLTLHVAADVPEEIVVDRMRLSRVLGNLVENAIKYSDGELVSIHASADDSDRIAFEVQDSGPGFSREAMDRLFDFRGRPPNSTQPGSGLGLHIAHSLISQMNGEIVVWNRSDGASVKTILPHNGTYPASDTPADTASVSVLPSTRLPDLSDLNILLAEDNTTNQMVIMQMLEAMGATFTVASDGIEALQRFEEQEFDLALLDIEMPRLSGLDVIRTIRARDDARAQTPIVAFTAYAMREHRERIAAAGADGLIAKPILGIEDLGASVLNYYRRNKPAYRVTEGTKAAVGGESDIIDEEIFNSLNQTIGDTRMRELLEKVATDLISVENNLRVGRDKSDVAATRAGSHILISVAGAVGATGVQHLAERLNKAAHDGNAGEIQVYSDRCLVAIRDLVDVVNARRSG